MTNAIHEIRDPIHGFIRLDSDEREVLDSRPMQRLRHIHQLATTFLVYPGATHKRFEHSLGVMELAGRAFDIVTDRRNIDSSAQDTFVELGREDKLQYWRRTLRMAALCHDLGHPPFSHASEDLLPSGMTHEDYTRRIIECDEMKSIWETNTPPLRTEQIVKLAIGPTSAKDLEFTDWETLLSEIIVGNAIGMDRLDYLLRDSHHAGVGYGKFDHYRLIDTIRILPYPTIEDEDEPRKWAIGIEKGGIHSVEAMAIARYLMYSQVYFHPVRRVYDWHLTQFLASYLNGGKFPENIQDFLNFTDNKILLALQEAATNQSSNLHLYANRILGRDHFKRIYERNPIDSNLTINSPDLIAKAVRDKFGSDQIWFDKYEQSGGTLSIPVQLHDNRIAGSDSLSSVLMDTPKLAIGNVYAERGISDKAVEWIQIRKDNLLKSTSRKGGHDG